MRALAYVHGYLPHLPAGSETMLHEMLLALQRAGHDVAVVSTDMRVPTGTMYTVDTVPVFAAYPLDAADATAADWLPDVVISHHEHAARAIGLAHSCGVKAAVMFHNDFPFASKLMRSGPDLAVMNTHWLNRSLAPAVRGIPSVIVHPPVDPARHRTTPGEAVTMINLYRMKGPDFLWRLAHQCTDLKFLAVKGGYGKQLVHPGYGNVEVIEPTQDMPGDVWSRTRVLIVPSRYESYGKVAVEAMVSGIPVIAATTAGLRESVGRGGALITRADPLGWHRRLRALTGNTAEWEKASAMALARAADIEAARPGEMAAWVDAVERLA